MHNKEYALKLVQEKQNGLNNYSYSQIGSLTGFSKRQLLNFSKQLNEKDIDSILVHGLTNKPSNNSPSNQEIEFIKNFKNKYPVISISQFQDIYHEDVIWNPKMKDVVKENNLKVRSYSFYESLYERFHWIKPIKHKCFNKEYETHPLREPSPKRGILIMIDGTPHDWFQNGRKSSLHLAIDDATGESLCGWFMPNECLEGYVHMLEILVTKYGIPENIYCDKHTILISPKDGNLTNFGHMCEDLGINIIAANTPQAKGKVEKWNNTIQNRLINDIKRYNIKSIDELNIFFNDYYCNYLNQKYSYEPKEVIPILNSFKDKIIAVKGNCDADVDDMMYDFDLKEYLKTIPFNDQKIFLSHGHVYNEDNLPALKKGDIFMYGHTHIPVIKFENGYYIFNPGSLTLPKGGHERTYGVLDDNGLYIYTIDDRLYMECHFKSDDR